MNNIHLQGLFIGNHSRIVLWKLIIGNHSWPYCDLLCTRVIILLFYSFCFIGSDDFVGYGFSLECLFQVNSWNL